MNKIDKDILEQYVPETIVAPISIAAIVNATKIQKQRTVEAEVAYKTATIEWLHYQEQVYKKQHPLRYFMQKLLKRFRRAA